jgi:hypothetical protein
MPVERPGCCRNLAARAVLTGMLKQTDEQRARAERIFKGREVQRADAPQAVKDYYAKIAESVEQMKRLRAARLKHEAEEGS